ncbi:MAG: D-alanyl-D-alanine carboxypeptidase family protein [Lachnospiraceae bacterium]|nr:D-alanyl-D-alanine carboxypeptidase family protein [Lachnospiraceae bacterium]
MKEEQRGDQGLEAEYQLLPYFDPCKVPRYYQMKERMEQYTWEEVITYVNIGLDHDFYTNSTPVYDPDCLTVLVNKYHPLPKNYVPKDLEQIHPDFNADELLLRREAAKALEEMGRAAREEGILLQAISAFRSYEYQEEVYLRYKTPDTSMEEYQQERDKVSARPGYSEHQTGLAVDINDLEETFALTPAGIWLAANSHYFGYILRYPKGKEAVTGYSYEPWHFRYIGRECAEAVHASGLTFDEYAMRYLQC